MELDHGKIDFRPCQLDHRHCIRICCYSEAKALILPYERWIISSGQPRGAGLDGSSEGDKELRVRRQVHRSGDGARHSVGAQSNAIFPNSFAESFACVRRCEEGVEAY